MIRLLSFTVLALFLLSSDSFALITKTSRVELQNDQAYISIGPDIYVMPDPEEKLTFQTIMTRHENNMRGKPNDSRLINLGLGATSSWLIFTVINNSAQENWLLDFGNVMQGRSGFAEKLTLQEGENIIAPVSGTIFPLNIQPGETKQYAVYIKPAGMMPHIINPRLSAGLPSGYIFSLASLEILLLMAFVGIFAGFAVLQDKETNILFAVYFALNLVFLVLLNHLFFLSVGIFAQIISMIFPVIMIAGLLLTKSFLRIRTQHYMENVMIFSLCLFVGVLAIAAAVLPQSLALLRGLMIFVPCTLSVLVICALCYLQIKNKRYPASSFGMGWACLLGGLLISSLAGAGLLGSSEIIMNAYWFALLLQGGFFIAAMREQSWLQETTQKSTQAREIHEAQSQERLRKSKESVDQARLIRVIERERELMAELREREMKRTEEMRKAKIVADKANLAKSSFLAVISHEIRTPMTGILGTVKLLTDTKLSREQSDLLMAIKQSGDTMLSLLNDILDFEKMEKGRMDLEHISFDLPKLANDVMTLMGGHARDKGISLKCEISDNFPRSLMGDPTRLRQVLLNLVNNSIKFTEKGSITIRLQEEMNDSQVAGRPRNKIFFMVKDTGIGISERAQRNLFNPFQQADETVTRKFGGSGLGLAICKNLIEAMGGKLMVESQEGVGSEFFFTLTFDVGDEAAAAALEAKSAPAPKAPEIEVPPLDVLVVEDNEVNRKVIAGFLEKKNHKSTLCASGEEALKLLKQNNYDLILIDIWMTGISGVQTTQTIRAMPDYYKANTPIIAISGNTGAKDIEEYMRAGMNGYLQKPIDFDKLIQSIANIYTSAIEARRKFAGENKTEERNPDQAAPIFQFLNQETGGLQMEEEKKSDFQEITVTEIDPNVFDPKILESLRKTLGVKQLAELLQGFIEKTDDIVRSLKNMTIETEAPIVKARAHELRGMAANFGVKELSSIASKIEELAKAGNVADALPEIDTLTLAANKAKASINLWLNKAD